MPIMPDADLILAALALAFLLDAWIGDPDWLYRRFAHPIAAIGRIIAWADRVYNRDSDLPQRRRAFGLLVMLSLGAGAGAIGWAIQAMLLALPFGWLALGIVMSVFIAQKSLAQHVAAVAKALRDRDTAEARRAVARIVGRDPERLDRPAIARAAIESLAENFSDGIVAPVFWAAIFGLPGLLVYKTINTADSMIGHRNPRYRDFGWAAARIDDLVNLPASRLSVLLIVLAAFFFKPAKPGAAWRASWRDAPHHRSPNAGWPEAAMAGALGLALNGPRFYGGAISEDGWMNAGGRREVDAADIDRALALYRRANLLLGAFVILPLIFAHGRFPISGR